ncbi:MAG: short-chain dehydrogenase [Bacteroidales bacterium 52_46]|nr:MAG: short-chain dehydrogenase [Bacteroidales bacterium 52_46]
MEKKYVLVTGASSGIGAEIAKTLSSTCNVILNGRDEQRLKETMCACHSEGHLIWKYDVGNVSEIEDALKLFLEENGISISYFVHSAGYMKTLPIKAISSAILTESFNTNVIAPALITKVLANKKTNKGALESIVFISSNISNFGAKAFAAYSASKSGLDGLMHSLAIELAPKVRVNSVLPGGVRTRMTEHMYADDELIQRMASSYPLGLGTTKDIADTVEFLLSEKSRWITGQQITVDGGRTINITG